MRYKQRDLRKRCQIYGLWRAGYNQTEIAIDSVLEGLTDRSHKPQRYANQLPFQIEKAILQIKQETSHWSASKIRGKLIR